MNILISIFYISKAVCVKYVNDLWKVYIVLYFYVCQALNPDPEHRTGPIFRPPGSLWDQTLYIHLLVDALIKIAVFFSV